VTGEAVAARVLWMVALVCVIAPLTLATARRILRRQLQRM
jgi:hypothetical protein